MPPVGDWRLTSWGDVAALADRSDVLSVVRIADPGDEVDWRLGTQGLMGVVEGVAGRMSDVLDAVRAIEKTIADEVVYGPV